MSTSGSEWATEGWDKAPEAGDRWEPKDAVGKIVRLRMREVREVKTPFADASPMLVADVDQVEDADTFTHYADSGIFGAWFLRTFSERLPYSALGVVEKVKTDKGFPMYRLRPVTEEEKAMAEKALDLPGF